MASPLLRPLICTGLAALIGAACTSGRPRGPGRSPLPTDSAALLERALRQARPAYATQDEALRSGAYRVAVDSVRRADPLPGARVAAAPERPPPAPGAYVAQIAAFRDRSSAEVLARDAQRWLPGLEVRVEAGGEWHRVVVSGWPTSAEASQALARIQERYPAAWVRSRSVP